MGRKARRNGFYIDFYKKYKEKTDFERNSRTAKQMDNEIKTIYGNIDGYAPKSVNYNIVYMCGEGLILIDSDTAEITKEIQRLNELFGVQPFEYASTPSKGKTHFGYRTNVNSQAMIKNYLYAVSGKQTGMPGVDIRSYYKDGTKVVQGATFLRKKDKPESYKRPSPIHFDEMIEKLKVSDNFIPLVFLAPIDNSNNRGKLGGQHLKHMFENKSGEVNNNSKYKDRHSEEFAFINMLKSLSNNGKFTTLEFAQEYIPQMLKLKGDFNRPLSPHQIETSGKKAHGVLRISLSNSEQDKANDLAIEKCGFNYFKGNFYLTKRITDELTGEVYENVLINADEKGPTVKLRDENMVKQIKEKCPEFTPTYNKTKADGTVEVKQIYKKGDLLRPIVSGRDIDVVKPCIAFANGYVDKFGGHPNEMLGFTTTQITKNYKGKVKRVPEVDKLLKHFFGEFVEKGKTLLSYGLANHSLRVALFIQSKGGAGKTGFIDLIVRIIGSQNFDSIVGKEVFGKKSNDFGWSPIIDKSFININEPGTYASHEALEEFKSHIENKPNISGVGKNKNRKMIANTQTYVFTLNKELRLPVYNREVGDRISYRIMDPKEPHLLTFDELDIVESQAGIDYLTYLLVEAYISDQQVRHKKNDDFIMDNERVKRRIVGKDKYCRKIEKSFLNKEVIHIEKYCENLGNTNGNEDIMESWLEYLGGEENENGEWRHPDIDYAEFEERGDDDIK